MVLTTAASGVISEPLQIARVTLADCTQFRTWTGTSSQATALTRIHIAGLPPTLRDEYTEDELDSLRPFAIIETDPEAGNHFRFTSVNGPTRHYNRNGTMFVSLEQAVPDTLLNDPAELDRQFQNTVGAIIEHSTGSGLIDLAGTPGYLAINSITVHGPIRATHEERVASGDSIAAILENHVGANVMLGIEVRYKGAIPKLKRSVWNKRILIPTMREALEHWHGKFRPKHFTHAGSKEYGYAARKGEKMPRDSKRFRQSYTGRKLLAKGHTRPLVFSGISEKLSRIRDIRVNSKRGRAVLPPGFNRKHPKSRIKMRDEVTRVSNPEEKTLGDMADRSVTRRLNAIRTTTTKKLA